MKMHIVFVKLCAYIKKFVFNKNDLKNKTKETCPLLYMCRLPPRAHKLFYFAHKAPINLSVQIYILK